MQKKKGSRTVWGRSGQEEIFEVSGYDSIKFQIRPLLDNPDVTDETLIERLTEAANLEAERLNKLKRNLNKAPKINELQTPEGPLSSPLTTPAPAKDKTARAPPELKADVAEVKQMMLASLHSNKPWMTKNNMEQTWKERLQDLPEQWQGRRLHPLLQMWPIGSHLQRMLSFTSAAGKRGRATATGPAVTQPAHQESHHCHHCCREEQREAPLQACAGCTSTACCSRACQAQHWQEHKHTCKAVSLVEQYLREKEEKRWSSHLGNIDTLSTKQGKKLIKLIGRCKMVKCTFDNTPVTALWGTGAQATVINDKWRAQHLPHTTIGGIDELLGPEPLNGLAPNQTEIPFIGWVPTEFKIMGTDASSSSLLVPVLVSSDPSVAQDPIMGFNVIEEVIKEQMKRGETKDNSCAVSIVSSAFDIDAVVRYF